MSDAISKVPISKVPTPYAVLCPAHGRSFLTGREYTRQMLRPSSLWECPVCRQAAQWDDATFEFVCADSDFEQLVYANVANGESLRLYVYDEDGFHSGGQWFTSTLPLKYPDEQIDAVSARALSDAATGQVRITNGGDELVFWANAGDVLWPLQTTAAEFWERVCDAQFDACLM